MSEKAECLLAIGEEKNVSFIGATFCFFCASIPKRVLDTKKTIPNIEVCSEDLGVVLAYRYIERGLSY